MKIVRVLLILGLVSGSAWAGSLVPAKLDGKVVGGAYDPDGRTPSVFYPSFLSSPGESIDYTYYEYQDDGSNDRQIAVDTVPGHRRGIHVIYMKSIEATHTTRNAGYQFNDKAGGGWSGELDANTQRAGYTTIGVLSDGRAVCAFHQAGGAGNRSVVAVDAARGAGAFTVFNVDTVTYPPGTACPIWPR